ncbi:metal-dependent hydrolase [Thalassomonas actiniarum]|uniref:Metal-dependent hydrolase n=1 Tax=Thalassomonas actiniarum TaxID=485447 RepID=A0AAF0C1V7_9GAMM|nr:metal-dependent hydrolase [Thalassomonas actiniarum]WDD99411.1 metal-dependent hydrolase [Thalassomonas actiniarum]
MANFSTHISASIISSSVLGTVVLATKIASMPESLLLIVIGALSGLLPDLDADDSTSIGWLFSILAFTLAASFVLVYPLSSLLGIWAAAVTIYATTWYIIKPLFEKITVHRGCLHSILAVVMFALLGIIISLQLNASLNMALLVALFVILGSLTHLLLDECYSVDLSNNRLKSSFGTAMKLLEIRYPLASLSQFIIVCSAGYYLYPQLQPILTVLARWQEKLQHLTIMPSF